MADTTLETTHVDTRVSDLPDAGKLPQIRIYGHSSLFYWWPVWVVGYLMALVTFIQGGAVELGEARQSIYHLSSTPGLVFTGVLLLVIIITNVRARGVASFAVVLVLALIILLLAYLGWWDNILEAIPYFAVHLNLGFYLIFSTILLVAWLLFFFVFDRLVCWRVRPGQVTEEHLIGGSERSFDTHGMLFEEHGDDFFRHVILGLGAGDLKLMTTGAKSETIEIENVLFAQRKVNKVQRLIALSPDDVRDLRQV